MGLLTWIRQVIDGKATDVPVDPVTFFDLVSDVAVRKLAFQSAIGLISAGLCNCEFRTYLRGKPVKSGEYYLWNVRPNANQNASEFRGKLVDKLYSNNEVLIIEVDKQLLVADSFTTEKSTLYGNRYKNVMVDDLPFERTFPADQVMHLTLNHQDVNRLIGQFYTSYGKLLDYSASAFQRSRGIKGKLTIDAPPAAGLQKEQWEKYLEELTGGGLKSFFERDSAVLQLPKGVAFEALTSKTYNSDSSRDTRALVDDIYDVTGRAFRVPPALLRGELAENDQSTDGFLTFCLDPLANLIGQEGTGKRCGVDGFASGAKIEVYTGGVKHIDLLGAANGVDKLISCGACCVNDMLGHLGMPIIDAPWAWQHVMTKNYVGIENALHALEGGETDE